ncbi:MAG: acetate--CoA ligase family protein [Paracoccaceae bacterium]|nr:acetate--CoA ligase family protein [Paracoccaceae bacterium]
MKINLTRLLQPKTIALVGGSWVENVAYQIQDSKFSGQVWPVNPNRERIAGYKCYKRIDVLPGSPDAAFIGVNRSETIEIIRELEEIGCGGATCFASGFSETGPLGEKLQKKMSEAARDMPFLGPNCYGYLNYLDHIYMWPDQHGGRAVESGVAIIAQSSNIAINLTMQSRSTPIAYVLTSGNQAKLDIADLGLAMIEDPRVTAIGFYIEGIKDLRKFEQMSQSALKMNKPIIALKSGKTESSRSQSFSHTASITGNSDISNAFFERLGIVEVNDLDVFLESLKILHVAGRMGNHSVISVSCSGGEASLVSDFSIITSLKFPRFSTEKSRQIRDILGDIVEISNPFDYHTFIWGDTERMVKLFTTICQNTKSLVIFVLDIPRKDRCNQESFRCGLDAILEAKKATEANIAVISSLSESMTEDLADEFLKHGIMPLCGLKTGLESIDISLKSNSILKNAVDKPALISTTFSQKGTPIQLLEIEAKNILKNNGIPIPKSLVTDMNTIKKDPSLLKQFDYPLVLKGVGAGHKTESGLVFLNIQSVDDLMCRINDIKSETNQILIEEMVEPNIMELLVGVTKDETGLFAMTLSPGGILSELHAKISANKKTLILPTTQDIVADSLKSLPLSPLFEGYRGLLKANLTKTIEVIMKISSLIEDPTISISELEINPLIITNKNAYAADALIEINT